MIITHRARRWRKVSGAPGAAQTAIERILVFSEHQGDTGQATREPAERPQSPCWLGRKCGWCQHSGLSGLTFQPLASNPGTCRDLGPPESWVSGGDLGPGQGSCVLESQTPGGTARLSEPHRPGDEPESVSAF